MVIVAEGALDKNLKPIKSDYVKDILRDRLQLDTRVTTLGHTQRGGRPCAYDRILVSWEAITTTLSNLGQPTLQGVEAVNALLESTPETPSYMIGLKENKIVRIPLVEGVKQVEAGTYSYFRLALMCPFRRKQSLQPYRAKILTRRRGCAIQNSKNHSQAFSQPLLWIRRTCYQKRSTLESPSCSEYIVLSQIS
jgi:hypothetical protein